MTSTKRSVGRANRHTIADHALGALAAHIHGPEEAHDHDHDHDGMNLLPAGDGDHVVLTSIGIDIGSSGTQVAFARLALEHAEGRGVGDQVERLDVRRRQTIFQSPVHLTPFAEEGIVDAVAVGRLVDHAFTSANLQPDDIDCGVVILTGASRERANASAIADALAERCGDIVSASAGHHLEARLAAHGSGAVARSAEFRQRYLNVDIGGATTKLAVCDNGVVVATAALAFGGRLVATDKTDTIVRLEPWGVRHAAGAGFGWRLGGKAPWGERQAVARRMADELVAVIEGKLQGERLQELLLTEPLDDLSGIDAVVFSGGVGEYVYGRETRSFGDLGLPLGKAIVAHIDRGALPWPLVPAAECIRATALGASSYSVQLSGRTGLVTNPATLLPRRNLPVVAPHLDLADDFTAQAVAAAITLSLTRSDLDDGDHAVVLALRWHGDPEHARLATLASGVKQGFISRLTAGRPLYVLLQGDVAASLGAILRDELGVASDLLVLDGIELSDLEYVDLGRLRLPSGTVPVTIKSLVFRDERGQ